ncbi:hypothetical protein [Motilimonas sp. KMU-193]|uniref:hypothetical protein n=1 Tax=Motilimonas sp. KMU-193 TaxID=3388668 RepID=UPI00396B1D50
MLRIRDLLWGMCWLLSLGAQANNEITKATSLSQGAYVDEGVPAQVNGSGFISLNTIINTKPFRARVNYVGDESLAMELMFALSDAMTGKVIWLEQRRTSQYMFEISHASLHYDAKRYQLNAYQVIRPILLAELTPKITAAPSQAPVETSQRDDDRATSRAQAEGQCSVSLANGETFWQLAKRHAKIAKLNIYDSVVSLFYSNLNAFKGANIEQLNATRLRCPSEQQIQWWQKRGDSSKIYSQLLQGASYNEVINLNEMPNSQLR